MGELGYTYGSEWHLLRFLGYHRAELNLRVEATISGSEVLGWLDHPFRQQPSKKPPDPGCFPAQPAPPGRARRARVLDKELTGISFLDPFTRSRVKTAWHAYWPDNAKGKVQNWDAVGEIEIGGVHHWLLVEAKGRAEELQQSGCGATAEDSLMKINNAFKETRKKIHSASPPEVWTGPYYQFCNRLAFLGFLQEHQIPAVFLCIYFVGDLWPEGSGVEPPSQADAWTNPLNEMYGAVGWNASDPENYLAPLVHRLFLSVHGSSL